MKQEDIKYINDAIHMAIGCLSMSRSAYNDLFEQTSRLHKAAQKLAAASSAEPSLEALGVLSSAQMRYMAERFLTWKLPKNFNPDGGISYTPTTRPGDPNYEAHRPSGTNLWGYHEAEDMVHYMVHGLPAWEAPEPRGAIVGKIG